MYTFIRLTSFLFWVGVVGCHAGSFDAQRFDKTVLPYKVSSPKGKYSVGRTWEKWTDPQRKDRELSVFIYYPVIGNNQESTMAAVLPTEAWQQQHFDIVQNKLGGWAANRLARATVPLINQNINSKDSCPVIVFGPGMGWLPTDYSELIVSLVADGYMVVAFAGQPVSPVVQFPDQRFGSWTADGVDRYALLAADMQFIVDHLNQLSQNERWPLRSNADLTKLAVAGHSISGAATLLAGTLSPQIKALVNLDGDVLESAKTAEPVQPILYLTTHPRGVGNMPVDQWGSERNEKRRDLQFQLNAAKATSSVRLKVPAMLHGDFLDAAHLPLDSIATKYRDRFGSIGGKEASNLTVSAITTFLNRAFYSKGDWTAFKAKYPTVLVQEK